MSSTQTVWGATLPQLDKESIQELEENDKVDVQTVQIDGMTLLKLINHCAEKVPSTVSGILLGLNKKEVLEVSNCFPMISKKSDAQSSETETDANDEQRYQREMMRCLRDINVDCNTVGWYQSTYLESFMNEKTIDAQYQYQLEFGKKCVLIVFDPLRTRRGQLYVKAYRLGDKFFDLIKESVVEQQHVDSLRRKYSTRTKTSDGVQLDDQDVLPASIQRVQIIQEVLTKLNMTSEEIFEELPLTIHNIALVEAFIFDISKKLEEDLIASEFETFDLGSTTFLERSLESLIGCADELTNERNKYQFYQRRLQSQKQFVAKKKEKGAEEQEFMLKSIVQPSQLNSLMASYQITDLSKQVNTFAAQSLTKLHVAHSLFTPQQQQQ